MMATKSLRIIVFIAYAVCCNARWCCGQDTLRLEAQKFVQQAEASFSKYFSNCCFEARSRAKPLDVSRGAPSLVSHHFDFACKDDCFRIINTMLVESNPSDEEWERWATDGTLRLRGNEQKRITLSNRKYSALIDASKEQLAIVQMGPPITSDDWNYSDFIWPKLTSYFSANNLIILRFDDSTSGSRPSKVLSFQYTTNESESGPTTIKRTYRFDSETNLILGVNIDDAKQPLAQVEIEYEWSKDTPIPLKLRRQSFFSNYEEVVEFRKFDYNCLDVDECQLSFYGFSEPPGEDSEFPFGMVVLIGCGIILVVTGYVMKKRGLNR